MSKTTVSRVINGSPDVASATRGRVLEAIDKLGYKVNLAARTLRTSRSALVGLLVPGLHEVFAEIAQELAKELRFKGISMLMVISEWETDGAFAAWSPFDHVASMQLSPHSQMIAMLSLALISRASTARRSSWIERSGKSLATLF